MLPRRVSLPSPPSSRSSPCDPYNPSWSPRPAIWSLTFVPLISSRLFVPLHSRPGFSGFWYSQYIHVDPYWATATPVAVASSIAPAAAIIATAALLLRIPRLLSLFVRFGGNLAGVVRCSRRSTGTSGLGRPAYL